MDCIQIICIFAIGCGLISPAISEIIMETYINRGNNKFCDIDIMNSEYVGKTLLISIVNSTLNEECRYSCVACSRRSCKYGALKLYS